MKRTANEEPAAALDFWAGGQISSENVGPADGEHHIGAVDGPALYFWVAENAAGKSQHLALLARMGAGDLLRQHANITHGQLSAYFQIARTRVTFRRTAAGSPREPKVEHLEDLPRIEELPAAIDLLINGGNLEAADARARARLRALLQYSPVEADEATARELCAVLAGTAFADALPQASYRDAWTELCAVVKGRQKRFKDLPFEDAKAVEGWLLAQAREGVLEDQRALLERLNALGNVAEKVAAVQLERVSAARGVLDGQLAAAGGATESDILKAPAFEVADAERRKADLEVVRISQAVEAAEVEERRRERARETHGKKPDVRRAAAELTAARTALAVAARDQRESGTAVDEAETAAEIQRRLLVEGSDAFAEVFNAWRDASIEVAEACGLNHSFSVGGEPALPAELPDFVELVRATGALSAAIEAGAGKARKLAELDAAVVEARSRQASATDDLSTARQRKEVAESAHLEVTMAIQSWDSTAAMLAEDIDRPSADEIQEADGAADKAQQLVTLSKCRRSYEQEAANLEQAEALAQWLTDVGADYRQAAKDTWHQLATLVTAALGLPWLAVEGLDIKLYYDQESGRLATAKTEAGNREERSIDDLDAMSTAELHESMLKLMLTRREKLGGILIAPWVVLAALDEARLGSFSADCKAANLVVFAERPRRRGDPEELVLEKVEPRSLDS